MVWRAWRGRGWRRRGGAVIWRAVAVVTVALRDVAPRVAHAVALGAQPARSKRGEDAVDLRVVLLHVARKAESWHHRWAGRRLARRRRRVWRVVGVNERVPKLSPIGGPASQIGGAANGIGGAANGEASPPIVEGPWAWVHYGDLRRSCGLAARECRLLLFQHAPDTVHIQDLVPRQVAAQCKATHTLIVDELSPVGVVHERRWRRRRGGRRGRAWRRRRHERRRSWERDDISVFIVDQHGGLVELRHDNSRELRVIIELACVGIDVACEAHTAAFVHLDDLAVGILRHGAPGGVAEVAEDVEAVRADVDSLSGEKQPTAPELELRLALLVGRGVVLGVATTVIPSLWRRRRRRALPIAKIAAARCAAHTPHYIINRGLVVSDEHVGKDVVVRVEFDLVVARRVAHPHEVDDRRRLVKEHSVRPAPLGGDADAVDRAHADAYPLVVRQGDGKVKLHGPSRARQPRERREIARLGRALICALACARLVVGDAALTVDKLVPPRGHSACG